MALLLIAIKMVLIGQNYGLQIRAFLASAKPEKMYLYLSITVTNHINDHNSCQNDDVVLAVNIDRKFEFEKEISFTTSAKSVPSR